MSPFNGWVLVRIWTCAGLGDSSIAPCSNPSPNTTRRKPLQIVLHNHCKVRKQGLVGETRTARWVHLHGCERETCKHEGHDLIKQLFTNIYLTHSRDSYYITVVVTLVVTVFTNIYLFRLTHSRDSYYITVVVTLVVTVLTRDFSCSNTTHSLQARKLNSVRTNALCITL